MESEVSKMVMFSRSVTLLEKYLCWSPVGPWETRSKWKRGGSKEEEFQMTRHSVPRLILNLRCRSKLKSYAARWRAADVDILTPRLSNEDWLRSRELLPRMQLRGLQALKRPSLVQLQSANNCCQLSLLVKWSTPLVSAPIEKPHWVVLGCTKTWIDKVTTGALFTVNVKHFHQREPPERKLPIDFPAKLCSNLCKRWVNIFSLRILAETVFVFSCLSR